MLYIYLPVLYFHGNLYVTEGLMQAGGVFCCVSGLSCFRCFHPPSTCRRDHLLVYMYTCTANTLTGVTTKIWT